MTTITVSAPKGEFLPSNRDRIGLWIVVYLDFLLFPGSTKHMCVGTLVTKNNNLLL